MSKWPASSNRVQCAFASSSGTSLVDGLPLLAGQPGEDGHDLVELGLEDVDVLRIRRHGQLHSRGRRTGVRGSSRIYRRMPGPRRPAAVPIAWMCGEARVPLVRPLAPVAPVAHPHRPGGAAADHRARRGRRGDRHRRRLRAGPPLRPSARLAVPVAGGHRGPDQPHRDRHRRHRHAVREPAVHGRGGGCGGPDRRRPSPAGDQPGLARAGAAWLGGVRLRARRRAERRRPGPGQDRGVPRRHRRQRGGPSRPADDRARGDAAHPTALPGTARPHLVGLRAPAPPPPGWRSRG